MIDVTEYFKFALMFVIFYFIIVLPILLIYEYYRERIEV